MSEPTPQPSDPDPTTCLGSRADLGVDLPVKFSVPQPPEEPMAEPGSTSVPAATLGTSRADEEARHHPA
ncbi:hypothetical protein [Streptomyces sp. NPDC006510]|uniref:hypothetical protein n=1 Tax=Streptomyces sp. NPDC006510 TaxID=3155600 RepID=UPI0033BCC28E